MDKNVALQRACTCRRLDRTAECQQGYHEVDRTADLSATLQEARELQTANGVSYRVIDVRTNRVLS